MIISLLKINKYADLTATGRKRLNMWEVVVDITPRTIAGTKGCHKYVFGEYKTKKCAEKIKNEINDSGKLGKAYIEKK